MNLPIKYPERSTQLEEYAEPLAQALGWVSIGLGIAAVAAPRSVAKLIGAPDWSRLVQVVGFRELASGIGILSSRHPTEWIWSRVAGDTMDLVLLGGAYEARGADQNRVCNAMMMVAGVTALDILCAQQLHHQNGNF